MHLQNKIQIDPPKPPQTHLFCKTISAAKARSIGCARGGDATHIFAAPTLHWCADLKGPTKPSNGGWMPHSWGQGYQIRGRLDGHRRDAAKCDGVFAEEVAVDVVGAGEVAGGRHVILPGIPSTM